MRVATKKKIVTFIRYITRIGFVKGLLLYIKVHVLHTELNIETGFLKFPITLRKSTTDLATFDQVFISRIYNLPFSFAPQYIIDCGANVGMTSIYFANRFPSAQIIAVEPEHSNFQILKKNCEPYPNIHVVNKAIAAYAGKVEVVDQGTGHYGFTIREIEPSSLNVSVNTIESASLEDIMQSFNWDHIDFLKIDIEGTEKELFSVNYQGWLSRTKSLAVEIHDRFMPGASTAVIKAIANYDFSVNGSAEGFFCERNNLDLS